MPILKGKAKNVCSRLVDDLLMYGFSLLVMAIALTPTWIYLLARFFISPENDLVEILLFGISLVVMGGFQLFLLVVSLFFLVIFWLEK